MLWFNFILGSNFIFLLFQIRFHFELRIKLYHNIYIHAVQIKDITSDH